MTWKKTREHLTLLILLNSKLKESWVAVARAQWYTACRLYQGIVILRPPPVAQTSHKVKIVQAVVCKLSDIRLFHRWGAMDKWQQTCATHSNTTATTPQHAEIPYKPSSPARVSANCDRDPGKPAWSKHFSRSGGMLLSANHSSSLLFTNAFGSVLILMRL